MHADRTNRTLMIVLALLLLAVGLDAGAASIGVYGAGTEHSTLMDNPTGRYFGAHGVWLWPVVAVAALMAPTTLFGVPSSIAVPAPKVSTAEAIPSAKVP